MLSHLSFRFRLQSQWLMRSLALLVVMGCLTQCTYNPVTGKKEFSLMSTEQEIALGKQSDPSIVNSFGLYEDARLQAFINEKGKEMAAISHRPDLDYQFRILDSPVVNAFAVPGGYVYFTRGILAHFNNEAEFAGVLGHEIGHITARHSAKQYTQQMVAQLGLVAGMLISEDFREYAGAASQGLQMLLLKFGRDQERQSDKLGVAYSSQVGYDATHMANFFNTLHQMRGEEASTIPSFLSTHPDPLDRYEKVNQMASKWQQENPDKTYAVKRDSYLQMIDGLVYGEDPRQGYVENGVFYHPELKFQFSIPANWQTINSPQQVQMFPENKEAATILMLAKQPSPRQAAEAFVTDNQLTLVNSEEVRVNGLNAVKVISDQYPQQAANQAQASSANRQQMTPTSKTPSSQPAGSSNSGGETNTNTNTSPGAPTSKTGKPVGSSPNAPGNGPGGQTHPGGPAPELRVQSYFIEYEGRVYGLHGLAKYNEFNRYLPSFNQIMTNFRSLSDPAKINVSPTRLRIKTAPRTGSLSSVLQSLGMEASQVQELAVLNGMQPEDSVEKGSYVKVFDR